MSISLDNKVDHVCHLRTSICVQWRLSGVGACTQGICPVEDVWGPINGTQTLYLIHLYYIYIRHPANTQNVTN